MSTNKNNLSMHEFYEHLSKKNRAKVLQFLQDGILKDVQENDLISIYKDLLLLRDHDIIDYLTKEVSPLPTEIFSVDYNNINNRRFVFEVLDKHSKNLDLSTDESCCALFEIACQVECFSIITSMISKSQAKDNYKKLVIGSYKMLQLTKKIKKEDLTDDMIVSFFVEAALSRDGMQRIEALRLMNYDIHTLTKDGKDVCGVLEETISTIRYPKNKSGALKQRQDLNMITYIKNIDNHDASDKEEVVLGKAGKLAILIVIIAVIIFGIFAIKATTSDSSSSTVTADTTISTTE
ncbi:hypothetical protein [Eubacterium oxidoreducens]|uniref:Uncharacterized protein n=1 Tax=Eubacterium oxidoreducens TaxID=1732 RepID=A0A1G6BKE7_EUBOX|nr:hypothetical protein [Eubacterium oxidoreducens]SDB21110.1 hypothetical protein SAMN02910417_01570 [Eubacterium oxidoreducens]